MKYVSCKQYTSLKIKMASGAESGILASRLLITSPNHTPKLQVRLFSKVSEMKFPCCTYVSLNYISHARRTFPPAQGQSSPYLETQQSKSGAGCQFFFQLWKTFSCERKKLQRVVRVSGWVIKAYNPKKCSTFITEIIEKHAFELLIIKELKACKKYL